jgi:hypothetical protein
MGTEVPDLTSRAGWCARSDWATTLGVPLPDGRDHDAQDQEHPPESCVIVHGCFNLCISARNVASGVTPTCRATAFPFLKIRSAGIEETS